MTRGDSHIDSPSQHRLSDQVLANTRDAAVPRHTAGAPVGGSGRPALQRLHDDMFDLGIVDRARRARSRFVGWDIPICRQGTDHFSFDSQSCKEGGPDLSSPRQYGTVNKVTGELYLANEVPKLSPARGSFICKRAEPVIK